MAMHAGTRTDDPTVEVFLWVSKDFTGYDPKTIHKDDWFVWYEYDKKQNLGYSGRNLVWLTRFDRDLKKLWEGALDEFSTRREMLLRAWFTHIAREIQKAKGASPNGLVKDLKQQEDMEKAMRETHIAQ